MASGAPILVTGAAGFVGRHLLEFLGRGADPLIAWRQPASDAQASEGLHAPGLRAASLRWMVVDVLDRRAVEEAVAATRPAQVYHLAASAHAGQSWSRSGATLQTNALGTHHLLEALRRADVRARVLVPGSATVYRASSGPLTESHPLGPDSPYAISKLAQEQLGRRAFEEDGLPVVLTRSFNHIGPGQSAAYAASSFARQIALIERGRQSPVLRTGNLEPKRDLTDVRDTVRAYRLLMAGGQAGTVYNVCSERAWSMGELLQMLLAASHATISVETDRSLYRPSDHPLLVGSATRLRDATGWRPAIPLDRSLAEILDYWRERV